MDKRAKDKLVRSPRENGGGQDAQKDPHLRNGRDEEGKTQKKMERGSRKDLQVLGVRRWRELVADRKKWKDIVRQAKAHSGLQYQWKKKKNQLLHTMGMTQFKIIVWPSTSASQLLESRSDIGLEIESSSQRHVPQHVADYTKTTTAFVQILSSLLSVVPIRRYVP